MTQAAGRSAAWMESATSTVQDVKLAVLMHTPYTTDRANNLGELMASESTTRLEDKSGALTVSASTAPPAPPWAASMARGFMTGRGDKLAEPMVCGACSSLFIFTFLFRGFGLSRARGARGACEGFTISIYKK